MPEVESLNHTAMCVHDLAEAVDFYCGILGARRQMRVNFQLEEVLAGVAVYQSVILEDYMFALTVAPNDMPMPPVDTYRGANGFRHGFCVSKKRFAEIGHALRSNSVGFEGPIDHPEHGPFGQSVYFKDPSGNFLEILWRRDEDVNDNRKRRYITTE